MSRVGRRHGAASGAALTACCALIAACTYDFDKYVTPKSSGGAGHASGAPAAGTAGAAAGRAGSPSGGTSGRDGSTATGGSSNGNAGDGGAADDGGAGATPNSGGRAGHGGSSGGSTALGGAGGRASAGGSSGGTSAGSGTAGGAPVACSDGTAHDGHCYFLVGTNGGLDWEHAKGECEAQGAHLVTITSSGEQTFVATTFFPSSGDAWLGLSLEDTRSDPSFCKLLPDACPFEWVTGEKLEYAAWATRSGGDDEPNFTGACARLQADDQAWADTGCESTFRAVCEREP